MQIHATEEMQICGTEEMLTRAIAEMQIRATAGMQIREFTSLTMDDERCTNGGFGPAVSIQGCSRRGGLESRNLDLHTLRNFRH